MKKHYRKHSSKGSQAQPGMVAIIDSKDMWNNGPQSVTTQCYVDAKDIEIEGITLGELIVDYKELKKELDSTRKLRKFFTGFAQRLEQTSFEIKGEAKKNVYLKHELLQEKKAADALFDTLAAYDDEEEDDLDG